MTGCWLIDILQSYSKAHHPVNAQAAHPRRARHTRYAAFSLLEVVAGLTIISLILVPTTGMMRDVLDGESVQRNRGELIHLLQGKQNEWCHFIRADFRRNQESGTFAAAGYPALRFQVACVDDVVQGGIPNRLMAIHTLGWHDADGDGTLDSGETSIDLWTSVSRATP